MPRWKLITKVAFKIMKGYSSMPADTCADEISSREETESSAATVNGSRTPEDVNLGVEYY